MAQVLHITNGDGAGNILKACAVAGDVLPWRDPMHHGPFPAGLDLDASSRLRARYLAGGMLDEDDVLRDFQQRDAHLRRSAEYDEVVLWFEHDLLDQLQIVQLLDWFAHSGVRPAALTMICIDRFEGVELFRGLGQLDEGQMVSLFDSRRPASDAQLAAARKAWQAFRDPDPRNLEAFIHAGDDALPFLRASLQRHLEEFPWSSDGLNRTERQILSLIGSGISGPVRVFVDNMDQETVLFMGDWATFGHIAFLCNGNTPLLRCEPEGRFRYPPNQPVSMDDFKAQRLSLSPLGEQVLNGRVHASEFLERDCWFGGVHLQSGTSGWAWDPDSRHLVQ